MNQIHVKPAAGRKVKLPGRPPHRNTVPAEGWLVTHDTFIERRLQHGDLVRVDAAAASPSADATPAPAPATKGAA